MIRKVAISGYRSLRDVRLALGTLNVVTGATGYPIALGLPQPCSSAFSRDPEIKVESQWTGETLGRSNVFAARNGPSVRIRGDAGDWRQVFQYLAPFDSMM